MPSWQTGSLLQRDRMLALDFRCLKLCSLSRRLVPKKRRPAVDLMTHTCTIRALSLSNFCLVEQYTAVQQGSNSHTGSCTGQLWAINQRSRISSPKVVLASPFLTQIQRLGVLKTVQLSSSNLQKHHLVLLQHNTG